MYDVQGAEAVIACNAVSQHRFISPRVCYLVDKLCLQLVVLLFVATLAEAINFGDETLQWTVVNGNLCKFQCFYCLLVRSGMSAMLLYFKRSYIKSILSWRMPETCSSRESSDATLPGHCIRAHFA